MHNEEAQPLLLDYCRWNWTNELQELLSNNHSKDEVIDITFDDGILFQLAASAGSVPILNSLLEYYENTQLNKYELTTQSYNYVRHRLQVVLQDVVDASFLSSEIQEVFNKYLSPDNHDSDEQDLNDDDFNSSSVNTSDGENGEYNLSESSAENDLDNMQTVQALGQESYN